MKLKCPHDRRVIVTDKGLVIHRNGDGSTCDCPRFAETLTIGGRAYSPNQIVNGVFGARVKRLGYALQQEQKRRSG